MKSAILFFAAVIVITGCTKSMNGDETQNEQSAMRIESIRGSGDFQSRVQMFNLLTADERFQMWHSHLVKGRTQFLNEGRPDKVLLVDELLNNFKSSLFDDISSDRDIFLNYFLPVWNNTAKTVFSEKEMYDLAFDPSADQIGNLTSPGGGELPGDRADCFCHTGQTGFSCIKTTVGFPSGVEFSNGVCELVGECNYKRFGCGWFWIHSCSGNHCNFG